MLHCLFIAQRAERPRRGAITFSQGARFLQNAGREHFARSMINALVEGFLVRTQVDAENVKAEEWIAAFLPETGYWSLRANADFQRLHNLGNVVGMDRLRGGRVEPAQELMQIICSAFHRALSQARAQCL